ncbi:MAG: S1 RNA-binding domain-containing protein [Anaerolineales bacterium]|nr:S1 RNA-binding domain-containing protein [Anaerolineales bacterium]
MESSQTESGVTQPETLEQQPQQEGQAPADAEQVKLERGDIIEGTILTIESERVTLDLGMEREGIVSIHDLQKIPPERRDNLIEGAQVPVYIVEAGNDSDHITASLRQAMLNEKWLEAEQLMKNREIWEGKVVGYNQRGLIVPFGNLRGFVPVSHMVDIPKRANPAQIRERLGHHVGRTLPLRVIEVDRRRRRLILSYRAAFSDWREKQRQSFLDSLEEGQIRTGRVRELKDFGAFVDLGGGDGLIHISEFAWHRINHPKEMLRVGQEIQVYVLKVNRKRKRVALSLKRLAPHPWETVNERYHVNQLIEGQITRVTDFGAFVEIEKGIEGLLHTKHLPRRADPDPRKVLAEGEKHLVRIINIEPKKRRIRLSLRAVSPEEQMEWMINKAAEVSVIPADEAIGLAELIGEEEE